MQIDLNKLINQSLEESLKTCGFISGSNFIDDTVSKMLDAPYCKEIDDSLETILNINRVFLGVALTYYHGILRKTLLEQGIDIGEIIVSQDSLPL